jgi:hypothetical protein
MCAPSIARVGHVHLMAGTTLGARSLPCAEPDLVRDPVFFLGESGEPRRNRTFNPQIKRRKRTAK